MGAHAEEADQEMQNTQNRILGSIEKGCGVFNLGEEKVQRTYQSFEVLETLLWKLRPAMFDVAISNGTQTKRKL